MGALAAAETLAFQDMDLGRFEMSDNEIEQTAQVIKSMAHPLRLTLMCLLGSGEKSVHELTSHIGNTSQSNISQHLALLLERRILSNRKLGNQVLYSISDDRILSLIGNMREVYCGNQ